MTTSETVYNGDLFPFDLGKVNVHAVTEVTEDGIMEPLEAARAFNEVLTEWEVTSEDDKPLLLNDVLTYFILNAPSIRSDSKHEFVVGGKRYPITTVRDYIPQLRKWFRAYIVTVPPATAGYVPNLIENNRSLRNKLRSKCDRLGINRKFYNAIYDSASYDSGLTNEAREVARSMKKRAIESSEPLPLISSNAVTTGSGLLDTKGPIEERHHGHGPEWQY